MASVQDIMIAEVLLILFLAYNVMLKLKRYGFHVLRYGAHVSQVNFRIFHNGWMNCRDAFHAVLYLYCCVMDRT